MTSSAGSSCTSTRGQKQRRSSRRSCHTPGRDCQALSALGDFQTLPLEIFQMMLNYLSVKDISMLSMVSKTISSRLINYISTSSGTRRLLLQDFHNLELPGRKEGAPILEHYKSLGLLLKRCTLLLPTRDRLKYVHKVLSGVSCFKLNGCASPLHCLGLQCYGVFLQILTAGWDELECHRVFNFLWELSNLARKVQTVVSSKPVIPQEWLMENNARLLLLSGNSICFTFLASKAVNGRAVELARLMVFMALVCEKDLYCMDWAVKMMQKVCKVFSTPWERNNFLQCLENTFAHMLVDMLQAVLAGERDEEDSSFLNLFHLVNAQASFHKEILYLAMGNNSSTT